jgi:hypothetical protein
MGQGRQINLKHILAIEIFKGAQEPGVPSADLLGDFIRFFLGQLFLKDFVTQMLPPELPGFVQVLRTWRFFTIEVVTIVTSEGEGCGFQ